jgi:large subunit ribosomal protein L10
MSRYVKDLQIKQLRRQFDGVSDLMVVNLIGIDAVKTNELRLDLRKKGINMQVVPNALARRVLNDQGVHGLDSLLTGPSAIAWGGSGVVELAKEITEWARKVEKLEVKGGCVSGQKVDSEGVKALSEMPSREELLGRVVMLALSPAARVVQLAMSPGGIIAGQLKAIAEGSGEGGEEQEQG